MDEILAAMKKSAFVVGIFIGIFAYCHYKYTFQDTLQYARERNDEKWSPRITWYTGSYLWFRDRPEDSMVAYKQILTEYPTCQYAPKAMMRVADIYKNRNSYAEAKELYEKYLELYPEGQEVEVVKKKYEYVKFK